MWIDVPSIRTQALGDGSSFQSALIWRGRTSQMTEAASLVRREVIGRQINVASGGSQDMEGLAA